MKPASKTYSGKHVSESVDETTHSKKSTVLKITPRTHARARRGPGMRKKIRHVTSLWASVGVVHGETSFHHEIIPECPWPL